MIHPTVTSPAALPHAMRRVVCLAGFDRARSLPGAFTLVELTVVMSIMATLLGVGSLMYSRSLVHARAQSAAHRLAADIRAAQVSARTGSQVVTITFDTDSGTYKLGFSRTGATSTIDLLEEPYHARLRSIDAGGGTGILTFDGYGRPDAQAVIKLSVADVARMVTVSAETGMVHID